MKGRPYYKDEAIIKTFEFDGDVIDCVDIYKQPAFDHPLLKHHTIQMKPKFIPKRSTEYSKATAMNGSAVLEDTHPWLFTRGCPQGSIPITRMPYMNYHSNDTTSDSHMHYLRRLREHEGTLRDKKVAETHEYAEVKLTAADKFYGIHGDFNVQNPKPEMPLEFSLAQIWIVSSDGTTTVEAGWIVYPYLYGDYRTRFFTLWTNNGYATFCYNLHCPGFVWTNEDIRLDSVLVPLSVYGGHQYDINIEIFQDARGMDWWVKMKEQVLGYWPRSIVPKLHDGAKIHNVGGEITNMKVTGRHTSTPMGSGHFPTEGFKKSAFIKNIEVVDPSDRTKYIVPDRYETFVTNRNCYDLQVGSDRDLEWGLHFYYGGPGRSAICT